MLADTTIARPIHPPHANLVSCPLGDINQLTPTDPTRVLRLQTIAEPAGRSESLLGLHIVTWQ